MSKTEKNAYTVTAVIPAYNIGAYICRAIDSVLKQTRPADEIIVVDDGSGDNTAEKINSYGEKVRYIYQDNSGASSARNNGIQTATSSWIAFLDGDDEWVEDYLEKQMQLLERNPKLTWSSTNYFRCLCYEKRRKANTPAEAIEEAKGYKDYFDDYIKAHMKGIAGNTDTMIIKRQALIDAGMFTEDLYRAEDMDLWFRIAFRFPNIGFISEPLAIYHMRVSESLSCQKAPAKDYRNLIQRLLVIAENEGRLGEFQPCAAMILSGWMRSMLFSGRGKDARMLLEYFEKMFTRRYIFLMRSLTVCPKLTTAGLKLISRGVRALNLRKKLTRNLR